MPRQKSESSSSSKRGRSLGGSGRSTGKMSARGVSLRVSSRNRDEERMSGSEGGGYSSREGRSIRGGRARGGWFGDPEGHSESAQRGWERSDHGPSGWFGDAAGHSQASRRGWEKEEHGPSGWFGDPEGHSEASRRGWERGDHGPSGWYGDPEGHSEASRRGWGEDQRGGGSSSRSGSSRRGKARSR